VLQALHERYGPRGFRVIGFPCNDFASEEPDDLATIKAFCAREYGVTYELMDKVRIRPGRGETVHPLYAWLTAQGHAAGPVKWNFEKFLIDRQGRLAARFPPDVEPDHPAMITAIEAALARAVPAAPAPSGSA
jgi:glutathione peroxidase